MGERIPAAPAGCRTAGKKLWRSVVERFELDQHEVALLVEAVRVADVCAELQAIVDREGLLVSGRPHAALVELRQQRILLARLVVALRVPIGDQEQSEGRLERRGLRGVYALRGGAA